MQHLLILHAIGASALLVGCTRPPADNKPPCDTTFESKLSIPPATPIDILVVVDNSSSMRNMDGVIADALVNRRVGTGPGECPIPEEALADFVHCYDDLPPPVCEFYGGVRLGDADCGLLQLLAADGVDFRLGVITTDVGLCDNRRPDEMGGAYCASPDAVEQCKSTEGGGWGFRPQRGCLQPSGPPGAKSKVIALADLVDDITKNDDLADRLQHTLDNIQTFGSPYSRGLDAVRLFFDDTTDRAPECQNDLPQFLRDDAKLFIVLFSNQDDCSRSGDVDVFLDELDGEVCGPFPAHDAPPHFPGLCYGRKDALTPVAEYVDFVRRLKADPQNVSAALVAGIDSERWMAAGCLRTHDVATDCWSSSGQSPATAPGEACGPAPNEKADYDRDGVSDASVRGELPCCDADPAIRYRAFADGIGGPVESICSTNPARFGGASFDNPWGFIDLPRPSTGAIVVRLTPRGHSTRIVPRLAGTVCDGRDGWVLEEPRRIRLCGRFFPHAGETFSVLAALEPGPECTP